MEGIAIQGDHDGGGKAIDEESAVFHESELPTIGRDTERFGGEGASRRRDKHE